MDHFFFCDTASMLQLVCGDLQLVEMVHFICYWHISQMPELC